MLTAKFLDCLSLGEITSEGTSEGTSKAKSSCEWYAHKVQETE